MRTDKIDRLITALGNLNRTENITPIRRDDSSSIRTESHYANDDAVDISPSLRAANSSASEDTARQAKISRITSQIEQGVYRPKAEEISVALIKELGI